jgi:hypothetical protein
VNLREIRNELIAVIEDPSYSTEDLNAAIYATYKHIFNIVDVPSLKSIGALDTNVGENYVSLSELVNGEFKGRIKRVLSDDITIFKDLEALHDYYGVDDWDDAGAVTGVAQEGTILWYQPIPATAQTISFIYYKNPPEFTDDDATPTYIPDDVMQRKLLVSGTAYGIMNAVEDADDYKVAAKSHYYFSFDEDNRDSGISQFRAFVAKQRVHHISNVWNY